MVYTIGHFSLVDGSSTAHYRAIVDSAVAKQDWHTIGQPWRHQSVSCSTAYVTALHHGADQVSISNNINLWSCKGFPCLASIIALPNVTSDRTEQSKEWKMESFDKRFMLQLLMLLPVAADAAAAAPAAAAAAAVAASAATAAAATAAADAPLLLLLAAGCCCWCYCSCRFF